jgi:dTDP-4-amino-4,6-dideoxygalactose transaminase
MERIQIAAPYVGPEAEDLVIQVLRSGQLAQGAMVGRFEELVAAMSGSRFAVATANGTVSLEAALATAEIGEGDEVITSPLTFVATLNAILRSGATAVFADVRPDFTLDPAAVEAAITSRTKVIMPVHLYGLMADMVALEKIAERHGLTLIEDAAQAHGASQEGRRAGSFGLGSFSFYATKNVTSGEGGAVTTNSEAFADRLRTLRNQGQRTRYEYVEVGQNLRMTEVAAAIAIPQLEKLDDINAKRNRNAARLTDELKDVVQCPVVPAGRTHVWHQYTVLVPAGLDRRQVIQSAEEHNVTVEPYYPRLVWDYEPFRNHPRVQIGDTPVAKDLFSRCLSLPVHPRLSDKDLDRVVAAVAKGVANGAAVGGH